MRFIKKTFSSLMQRRLKGSPEASESEKESESIQVVHHDTGDVEDFVHVDESMFDSGLSRAESATLSDFDLLSDLGRGAHATVHLVRHSRQNTLYAMKVLDKCEVAASVRPGDPMRERNILKGAQRPLLVNLHFTFQTETKLFFVLDYLPGGNLFTYTAVWEGGRLPEMTARHYAAQMYLALQSLHDAGVIHRDLKPENVLLDEHGHVSIADFGLSRRVGRHGRSGSFVGTPFYVAPEILTKSQYGAAVDWWSYGVLLFNLLTGEVPFYGKEIDQVFDSVLKRKPVVRAKYGVSSKAKDLISRLLEKDESKRISGPQIRRHPWFKGLDWHAVETCQGTAPDWKPPVDMITSESGSKMPGRPVPEVEEFADMPTSSPRAVSAPIADEDQKLFEGFSFDNTNALPQVRNGIL
eukprot:Hpha_TRINITY_DN16217_c3_g7::TRINITY_DN16217_c3_g7_i3::g.12597::m.12597